jgi:putative oxidoreductase
MFAESTRFAIALLLLRLAIGIAFILHGAPKIVDAAHWMDQSPHHPPAIFQEMAAVAEFFGGWALLLGVATRFAAALIAIDMVVALVTVHLPEHAPLISTHVESMELPLVYLFCATAVLVAGSGGLSLDGLVVRRVRRMVREMA